MLHLPHNAPFPTKKNKKTTTTKNNLVKHDLFNMNIVSLSRQSKSQIQDSNSPIEFVFVNNIDGLFSNVYQRCHQLLSSHTCQNPHSILKGHFNSTVVVPQQSHKTTPSGDPPMNKTFVAMMKSEFS
jgi:hypothetical protein